MLVVYFLGAVWTAGSAIASGLFVPMLLIGSCIGRIVGLICVDVAASGGHGSPRLICMLRITQQHRLAVWQLAAAAVDNACHWRSHVKSDLNAAGCLFV